MTSFEGWGGGGGVRIPVGKNYARLALHHAPLFVWKKIIHFVYQYQNGIFRYTEQIFHPSSQKADGRL